MLDEPMTTTTPAASGKTVRSSDAALVLTDHRIIDYKRVAELAPLIIDTRNATSAVVVQDRHKIVRL